MGAELGLLDCLVPEVNPFRSGTEPSPSRSPFMAEANHLRRQAAKCRRLAQGMDERTAQALSSAADDYETAADRLIKNAGGTPERCSTGAAANDLSR
jgi:hypothetical protein